MAKRDSVLLTGATGFLGQYLLRDLLVAGRPVAVLVRDTADGTAEKRAADLVGYWSEILGRSLPAPRVLAGELGPDGPGLTAADRRWLAGACGAVVHAAASLAFRDSADGEPWRTNVGGTEALLALCRDAGVTQWHQVSTAFVCGRRCGPIAEDDALHEGPFHNPYEASKCEAERLLRRATGLRVSVYRPSLIVGDSRTGHTSNFNGLYRFLELATRLAAAHGGARLPVRLPMTGAEPWDLVPVDWVSRAIVELMARPRWHGHTFHLTGRSPVTSRVVRDVAAEVLRLEGVEFAGPGGVRQPDRLEQLFLEGVREYWPYFSGNPVFACDNTRTALPELPPPPMDRPLLQRLIRYAATQRWGRGQRPGPAPTPGFDCGEYIERVFPVQANRSDLAREAGLHLSIGIDVRGPGGGQWSCKWRQGRLTYVVRGLEDGVTVTYRTDAATFHEVVRGVLTPQEAFFERRVAITGDLETALKLAVLFGQFLAESPIPAPKPTEVTDASPCPP